MTNGADDADDDPCRTHSRMSQEAAPSENWDDDFEFQPRTVDQVRDDEYDATNAHGRRVHSHEHEESWDDAYADEDPATSPMKRTSKVDDQDIEDWDSSDNEAHGEHERQRDMNLNNEPLRRFEAVFEEEDKTVTARPSSSLANFPPPALPIPSFSTHAQNLQYPPPSLLPFHVSPSPSQHPGPSTSPTLSSFSIPISSNRASVYSQDPLMPTASNSSAPHLSLSAMRAYPQSAGSTPPRKSRRLRKKSRPPEADIFELEDREPDPLPVPDSPVPPLDPPSPPRPVTPPTTNAPAAPPTPSPSLLTRIGSLKRWARRSLGPDDTVLTGFRRGKSSTGPGENSRIGKSSTGPEELVFADESLEQDLRAVSPTPASGRARLRRSRGESASGQKAGWFFRAGGGGGIEKEDMSTSNTVTVSIPVPTSNAVTVSIPVPARTPEPSPSKPSRALGIRRRDKEVEGSGGTPTPKKMQGRLVPALRGGGSMFSTQMRPEQTSPIKASRDRAKPRQQTRPASQPQSHSSPAMQFPRHNGSASVGRSAGAPLSLVVSEAGIPPHEENEPAEVREREGGMRSLMNGVRKLSLVSGAHKRTKSMGGDSAAVEVARTTQRTESAGRPRSRTEDRPISRASAIGEGPRPVSRATTPGMVPLYGAEKETQALLPPVELDSPSSLRFARRRSIPRTDYDPVNGSSAPSTSVTEDVPAQDTVAGPSRLPPPVFSLTSGQQNTEKQSFSVSATSLLTGSPTRLTPAFTPPSQAPSTPQRSETPSHPRPTPISPQGTAPQTLPPVSSPRTASAVASAAQSASLGRSTASPAHVGSGLRRNSLGDLKTQTPPRGELKIPARISRAQQGLRRDLGMVREFATCVEQLKRLQGTYTSLIGELRAAYDASSISPVSRPISPAQIQFHLPSRPSSQIGANRRAVTVNPNPSMQSLHEATPSSSTVLLHSTVSSRRSDDIGRQFVRLEHEYGIWWECAELLVELGGGSVAGTVSNPNLAAYSGSALNIPAEEPFNERVVVEDSVYRTGPGLHVASMSEPGSILEHALVEASTSNGPPQASPPHPSQWRASTGRHDLSARQLRLLKDMLNTPNPASLAYVAGPYGYGAGYPPSHPYPYAVPGGGDTQPWEPWNPSTVTLPSEESSTDMDPPGASSGRLPGEDVRRNEGKGKKRRASRLGMLGLREILRGLKRNAMAEGRLEWTYPHVQPGSESSASAGNSAEDDHYNRRRSPWHQHDEHHGSKYSASPQEDSTLGVLPIRSATPKSPRRPSLASIFRLGQKSSKNGSNKSKEQSSNGNGNSTTEDERDAVIGGGAMEEHSDWERMSRSDLDLTNAYGSGTATVRGKKRPTSSSDSKSNILPAHPYPNVNMSTPKRAATASQGSLRETSPSLDTPPHPSSLPLSIAEEDSVPHHQGTRTLGPVRQKPERTSSWSQANPPLRPVSRNGKTVVTGTVRSAPPSDLSSMPDPKLALTPENLKPLLEYAKEVSVRLGDCIGEVRTLLSATSVAKAA